MSTFQKNISLRWSDLDPNFHLRHSVYYDLCAQQRIEILEALGLTLEIMRDQHFGPVLFREECVFKREIRLSDPVILTAKLEKLGANASRWSIRHEFLNAEEKILSVLTVEGAWMDTSLRKLLNPIAPVIIAAFNAFPKTDNFNQ